MAAPGRAFPYVSCVAILVFFVVHWQLSVFCQSFFLHRYGAHRQFTMSKRAERFFHVLTYVSQGSSYLSPRGYAILHRMHHAYSDTEKDPHSPLFSSNALTMMLKTKKQYDGYTYKTVAPEPRFDGGFPDWKLFDNLGSSWPMRLAWMGGYTAFYYVFATQLWMWALLPIHFLMGPVHGAIVNWCGHKYGYRNFNSDDVSRNMLFVDVLTAGELFQNNHHKFGMSPNFAVRAFELDPTFQVIKVLAKLGVVDITGAQLTRWRPEDAIAIRKARADKTLPAASVVASIVAAPLDDVAVGGE
jgi:stearoyl-CoA desaturase (delta-9 desaturase)